MLARLDWQEADKGNLHAGQCPQRIPSGIADIEAGAVPAHADENEGMHGEETGDEGVSTPRRHHVSVKQCAEGSPKHGAQLERLDPQIKGEDEKEDGNGFVVVAAGDGSRDVTRRNAHEDSSQETRRWRCSHLVSQQICGKRRQT